MTSDYRWNIISDYLNYADANDLNGDAYMYAPKEELKCDGSEKWFLIVGTWDFINAFNNWLEANHKEYLEEETRERYGDYFTDWLDFLTDEMWGFSDEYSVCNCCGKVFRTQDSVVPNPYWIPEESGEIFCIDCTAREYAEGYIYERINNPRKANIILSDKKLEEMGWKKYDYTFEHGWYGRVDHPEKILEKIEREYTTIDVLFSIIPSNNPFLVEFTLWYKDKLDNDERLWDTIASYMDDEIRETVHAEMAPCGNREFLERYLELDPDFKELLKNYFYYDVDEWR